MISLFLQGVNVGVILWAMWKLHRFCQESIRQLGKIDRQSDDYLQNLEHVAQAVTLQQRLIELANSRIDRIERAFGARLN
jgi:hypothetical protein